MKCYVHVRLNDAERTRKWIEVEAETVDAAIKVAEQMPGVEVCLGAGNDSSEYDRLTGDLTAMGGLGTQPGTSMTDKPDVLHDEWIPENTTTKCSEPLVEREWSGSSEMSEKEILVTAFEDDKGSNKAIVMRIDRSKSPSYGGIEALQPDGSWKIVGLYERNGPGFKLSNAEVKKA